MKEFNKYFNKLNESKLDERTIVRDKMFAWTSGDFSMQLTKEATGNISFEVFQVESGIEFTMLKKDVDDLNNWLT